jgi:hypothetical protein
MAGEFFVIEMNDVQLKSSQGNDTIKLKQELRAQYPGLNLRKAQLLSVMVVAKSAAGKGRAQLIVGSDASAVQTVEGRRTLFQSSSEQSFDRVLFKAPKQQTQRQPWQMRLLGNFKVRQIVVEVDLNPRVRVALNYKDLHIRTGQGDDGTLKLRAKAQQQQGIDSRNYKLLGAVVFAKSKRGGAKVHLKVGQAATAAAKIKGNPGAFAGSADADYHQIRLNNPKNNSQGPWQVEVQGNVKVQKVVLILEEK